MSYDSHKLTMEMTLKMHISGKMRDFNMPYDDVKVLIIFYTFRNSPFKTIFFNLTMKNVAMHIQRDDTTKINAESN